MMMMVTQRFFYSCISPLQRYIFLDHCRRFSSLSFFFLLIPPSKNSWVDDMKTYIINTEAFTQFDR
jgi:hypothetical protein